MEKIIGLIVFLLINGIIWLFSSAAKQAEEKRKQEAAKRQQNAAARQQNAEGRATPKKKFREIEQIRGRNNDLLDTFVTAETISPSRPKRESIFDAPIDNAAVSNIGSEPSGISSAAKPVSEHTNPIAQGIMAMMSTPQSMQQVVILSEIFNRPKYE